MKAIGFVLTGLLMTAALADKPPLDGSAFAAWKSVGSASLSSDGQYVIYAVDSGVDYNKRKTSSTIMAVDGRWKHEVESGNAEFTQDSKRAVFMAPENRLAILKLGESTPQYVENVASFKLGKEAAGQLLAYQLKTPEKELVLRDLKSGKEMRYPLVSSFTLSDDGKVLLLETQSAKDPQPQDAQAKENSSKESQSKEKKDSKETKDVQLIKTLSWISLKDYKKTDIWQGAKTGRPVFDADKRRLAFAAEEKVGDKSEVSVWYYEAGADKAVKVADNRTSGIDSGLRLDGISAFPKKADRLFISLKEVDYPKAAADAVKVDVWSYKDDVLQSEQLKKLTPNSYYAVLNLADKRIVRLQFPNDGYMTLDANMGDMAVIAQGSGRESYWSQMKYYLMSTHTGERKPLPSLNGSYGGASSPEGKYRVYFDGERRSYFSYEFATGATREITAGVNADWSGYRDDEPDAKRGGGRGIGGWYKDDVAVLIYDKHDIWRADPTGKSPPVNLTNGYGRQHNIVFCLALSGRQGKAIDKKSPLVLLAFNRTTKDNGFYKILPDRNGPPELLSMGQYIYDIPGADLPQDGAGYSIAKAERAERYLVRRVSATDAPNFFVSSDLKTFTRVSNVQPQSQYNWYTTELVTWKLPDGNASQGILYKPENLDPSKRYPIIFHYYDKKSDGLNAFLKPDFLGSGCNINVPYLVSNGYSVFMPDIHFKTGKTGKSALDTMVSAAEHLQKTFAWIDGKKMAIQGCSFGGFSTNYILTRTDIFAAAVSSSGLFDLVAGFGAVYDNGGSKQRQVELGQYRLGTTPWQSPDVYVDNSPVFHADKVTTPFLMMHTRDDGTCAFANAIEFFTALRRLGKTAWMLQYDDNNHGLQGKAAEDFSIRLRQFLDHYLKDAPPAKWMTEGVPAKFKGVETGLALDTSGKQPGAVSASR